MPADIEILRSLAREFADVALSDKCYERIERFRDINAKKQVRPPVLVFEVPWGEIRSDELRCVCSDGRYHGMEWQLRANLFQFKHFEGDYTVQPYYKSGIALHNSGIGLGVKERVIHSNTGAYISAHEYEDMLPDEDALERIQMPVIAINKEATEYNMSLAHEIYDGLLPVKLGGTGLYFASWDNIPRYHGVENTLCDLYDRPEFMHKIIETFTRINEITLDQYETLNVLDGDELYLHCTPAATHNSDLPVKDIESEKVRAKDVWVRAMAQIFAVVSPDMHEEFDLQYTKRLFERCGLSYYGCCEPLDNKIENLRQYDNLRRISITPWANIESAAEQIGGDYVYSYKPNPALVAGTTFDPEPIKDEITRVLEACLKNNTPCEFVLKDISTIKNDHTRLTQWVDTVKAVINKYF